MPNFNQQLTTREISVILEIAVKQNFVLTFAQMGNNVVRMYVSKDADFKKKIIMYETEQKTFAECVQVLNEKFELLPDHLH